MKFMRAWWTWMVLLAALAVTGTLVYAQPPGADPAINQPYENSEFEVWLGRFERPGREVYDKRREIVAATGVEPGMAVADIGAGTGLFTLLFASAVGPQGRVYAVDVLQEFVDNILRRAQARGLANVEGVVNTQNDAALPPQSVDLAFISDTYHHFEQPGAMLQAIHRALRPGGTLVIVDFRRAEGESSPWVMEHVRAGKDTVVREVEAAGFALWGEEEFLRENYFLRFETRAMDNAVQ